MHLDAQEVSVRFGGLVAVDTSGFAELDLHELVIGERLIDGLDESLVDTALADLHDRFERVREGPQVTSLLAG